MDEHQQAGYEQDVVAWAAEQARLIRAKQFDQLDIENIAEEIEDVGKSEQRELADRIAALLTDLLRWQHQPGRRSSSWKYVIQCRRRGIHKSLTPSLKSMFSDAQWQEEIWEDACFQAVRETGFNRFPSTCPWTTAQILDEDWLPE